jgi:hypothetical protein
MVGRVMCNLGPGSRLGQHGLAGVRWHKTDADFAVYRISRPSRSSVAGRVLAPPEIDYKGRPLLLLRHSFRPRPERA